MKPTRLTKIILVILGMIGMACLIYYYVQGNEDEHVKGEQTKMEQSKYPGVDIITDTFEEETYHKAVHYPKFKEQVLNTEMSKYVSKMEQNFYEELDKHDVELLKERPAQFYLTFDIYPVTDGIYSIVFYEEGYFGGANARLNNKVFLVDLKNKRYIKQTEIIDDTKESREKIYNLLLNAFKESKEYGSFLNEEYLKEWIENEDHDFSNMFLTRESVVFKFDKYEVTAGAAGMPEIALPFKEVREILSAEWVDKLNAQGSSDENEEAERDEQKVKEEEKEAEPAKDTSSKEKRVALTFDDGPHPKNTMKILELLKKHDAKATFFMLGSRVDFYPAIAKEIAENGHELGNHTWNHKDLTTLSSEMIKQEVEETSAIILQATG